MIKVCTVSNTGTAGVFEGGSTCQRAYRVNSSSRHGSCRDSSHTHTHTERRHFSDVEEKAHVGGAVQWRLRPIY